MLIRSLCQGVSALCLIAMSLTAHGANFEVWRTRSGEPIMSMTGEIKEKDGIIFARLVNEWDAAGLLPKKLILDSAGGDLAAHNVIMSAVLQHEITTVVPAFKQCASACVTVLLAGQSRYVHPDSRIIVHRVGYTDHTEDDYTRKKTKELAAAYRALNAPEEVTKKMMQTPSKRSYLLSREEKQQLQAVSNTWSGDYVHGTVYAPTNRGRIPGSERQKALTLDKDAVALLKQNKAKEAIPLLRKANIIYPANATILHHLGKAYYQTKQYKKARIPLTASLYRDENQPEAWRDLGLTMAAMKDVSWAADCFVNYWIKSEDQNKATQQLRYWKQHNLGNALGQAVRNASLRVGI